MRSDKEQALKLRLGGKSYTEIYRALGIPKSTLSGWLSNLILSADAREKIRKRAKEKAVGALLRRNVKQSNDALKRALEIRNQAAQETKTISKKELLFLGAALYWAEGYKRPVFRNGRERTFHVVSLTNSDPKLIKLFIKFLRDYCQVPSEKIKANIRIYRHLNEYELKKIWQNVTGIPEKNFQKTYYGISKSSQGIRPYNRLPYGVIQIIVADTRLFHRIMGYIEGIKRLI